MIYDISIICLRFSVDKHVQEKRIFWVQQRREIPTAFRLCSVRQPWLTCMRHKGISYNHPKLCNAKLVAQVYIYIHIWLYIIIHIYTHIQRGMGISKVSNISSCSQQPSRDLTSSQRALGGIFLVLNQVHGSKGPLAGEGKSNISSWENKTQPSLRCWY